MIRTPVSVLISGTTAMLGLAALAGCGGNDATGPADEELRFVDLALGELHTCGVTDDGRILCWGDHRHRQLGIGDAGGATEAPIPKPVETGLRFRAVAAGSEHTCGLSDDGGAWCWGSHRMGQLGVGEGTDLDTCRDILGEFPCSDVPVPVAGGLRFQAIDAGADGTCGLADDGSVHCWGSALAELAADTCREERLPCNRRPAAVPGGRTFASIAAFGPSGCGLTSDGEALCWGFDRWGRLGAVPARIVTTPTAAAPGLRFARLDLGVDFTCGVTVEGDGWCWGSNAVGQLGTEEVPECPDPEDAPCSATPLPVALEGGLSTIAVSAGSQEGRHACALSADGAFHCWGSNNAGQLGLEQAPETCESTARVAGEPVGLPCSPTPVPVAAPVAFTALEAGMWHNCGRTADGRVFCWGSASRGILGTGSGLGRVLVPTPVLDPGRL